MNPEEITKAFKEGLDIHLSKDVSLRELIASEYATRNRVDNIPNAEQIANLKYLAENMLQPIYNKFGNDVYYGSGFRCEKVDMNARGFQPHEVELYKKCYISAHRIGAAADILTKQTRRIVLLKFIYDTLPFSEMIAEFFDSPTGWVHGCLIKGREKERVLKLKDKEHDYSRVTIDYLLKLYPIGG